MGSLDLYNDAATSGVLSDNTEAEVDALQKECDKYESEIDALNNKINESNAKIGSWRTQKTTASTSYKKTLSSYISAEQEKITANRAKISALKDKISDCKSRIKTISSQKPASYYINKGTEEITDYYKDLLSTEKSNYGIWYEQNKDHVGAAELAKAKKDSKDKQVGIQQGLVDELTAAHQKMVDIYGADHPESKNLEEILSSEQYSLEKLKNTSVDIEDSLSKREKYYKNLIESEKKSYNTWLEQNKDTADIAEIIKKQNESLEKQAQIRKDFAEEFSLTYEQVSELLGMDDPASQRLQEVLQNEGTTSSLIDIDGIISDRRSKYKELFAAEENEYEFWYQKNKDSADKTEIAKVYNESVGRRVEIQEEFVEELSQGHAEITEIYGENSDISRYLGERLKEELIVCEKLKNSYMEMSDAIEETLDKKKEGHEIDVENAKLVNQLWNETAGKDAEEYEKRAQSIKSLNEQLYEQGGIVSKTAAAYKQMVEQYGFNSEESKKMENQLLAECIAYEQLTNKIKALYAVEEYDRKEREDIVFGLNDYLKNNKEFLLSTGMTEEEIYEAAREATGYNKLADYFLNRPALQEEFISSAQLICDIFNSEFKDYFKVESDFFDAEGNFSEGFINMFAGFGDILDSIGNLAYVLDFAGGATDVFSSDGGNSYSSVYNLIASSDATVADQLHSIKKYDAIKKARGLA